MSDAKRLLFHQCKLSSTAIHDLRQHGISPIKVDNLNDIRFFGNDGQWDDVMVDALEVVVNGPSYNIRERFNEKRQSRLKEKVSAIRKTEAPAVSA